MKLQCYSECSPNPQSSLSLMPCFECGTDEDGSNAIADASTASMLFTADERMVGFDGVNWFREPHDMGDIPGMLIRTSTGRLIAVDENNDAVGPAYVRTSDNNGLTWVQRQQVDTTNRRVNWKLFEHGGKIYTNETVAGAWVSEDDGTTWTQMPAAGGINPLLMPWMDGYVFDAGSNLRTNDNGATWIAPVALPPTMLDIGMSYQMDSGRWLVFCDLATYSGLSAYPAVAYSDDNGATWTEVHVLEPNSQTGASQLTFVPFLNKWVFSRPNCGLLLGSPDGSTWEAVTVSGEGFGYYDPEGPFSVLGDGLIIPIPTGYIHVYDFEPMTARAVVGDRTITTLTV